MKIIINENERGFQFQNGVFQCMLGAGKHRFYPQIGQKIEKLRAEGAVKLDKLNPKLLMAHKDFAELVTAIDIPDSHIAIHFVNGKIQEALTTGEYFFWSIHQKHTFRLLDISKPEAEGVSAETFRYIPMKLYIKVEVLEGECALLYYDGAFQSTLKSGTYYFWNGEVKVTYRKTDLRIQQLEVTGQEILTADKVAVRLNFVCSYQITDPVKQAATLQDFLGQLYSTIQLALRRYVGAYRLDELLEQKSDIADFILEKLRAEQERLFVEFKEAGLKDLILPGEIRSIMNTVLVAEKTAQANVISRREEVASTRSLLNTAKLLDENETLRRLKELEYLERICDKVGTISVGSAGSLLAQLQELVR